MAHTDREEELRRWWWVLRGMWMTLRMTLDILKRVKYNFYKSNVYEDAEDVKKSWSVVNEVKRYR